MRFAMALAALSLAFPPMVHAATFVQELRANEGPADMGPFDIRGQYFNSALGTLTAVNAIVTGIYVTSIQAVRAISAPVIPTTIAYDFNSFGPGNHVSGVAGVQGAYIGQGQLPGGPILGGGGLTGGPYYFSLMITFPNIGEFVGPARPQPGDQPTLGNFEIFTRVAPGLITYREAGSADDSGFVGTFQLSYTYDVPEPATVILLSLSVFSLGLARRKSAPNREA